MIDATLARIVRIAIVATATFTAAAAAAQSGAFTINGRVKVDGGSMDGVRVVVYKNGTKDRVLTSNLARFGLDLDLNASYILSFEKDGFVTKKLSFDTHAPAEAIANGFTPFEFAVSIFKQYDDVNMVIFNQPVGMIRYEASVDDFDYDTDYTKSIQSQLQETLAKVEEKQKEEERNAGSVEKAKQEEAKAKAKAEAEALKAAEAKKAEEARLKKEQEAAAVKAEADRKNQEAELAKKAEEDARKQAAASKAEQERLAQEAKKAEEEKRKQDALAKAEQERLALEARKKEEERKRAEAAKAEADRKAALAKKEEERPKPPPPVIKEERPVTPKPPPPPPVKKITVQAGANQGEDSRRGISPTEGLEESRMKEAIAGESEEAHPADDPNADAVTRNEELIVEKNQVITVIRLETDNQKNEYRKVVHKYGAVFYFKNGEAISQTIYEHEALAEHR